MAFDQNDRNDLDPSTEDGSYDPAPGSAQDNANTNATDPAAFYNAVAAIYKTALGREGTSQEINEWIRGKRADQLGDIQTAIYGSPEAQAYQKAQQQKTQANKPSAADYIKQWQGSHAPNLQELLDNMKAQGYNVAPWVDPVYGTSKNEIMLDGKKFKVLGGENSSNPFWYTGGDDSGPTRFGPDSRPGEMMNEGMSLEDYIKQLKTSMEQDPAEKAAMDALIKQLTDRSNQSLQIDPTTDAIIHPQVDAARVQMERQRKGYLNDLAESNNPYATGAEQTAATQSSEVLGTNLAGLQSTLVQNELTARRNEIAQALTEKGSLLTSNQQQALQRQLGVLDAAIKNKGLDQNNNQFIKNLMLQYGFLNSQNDQFAARFGMDLTNNANYWDWIRSHPNSTPSR